MEPTQQEKLTILTEGLFTEIGKKAFKRLRIAAPSLDLKPRAAARGAVSWQCKINHPLSIRASLAAGARETRSTRTAVAGRRPTSALALDGAAFMVQCFRKIT
jgi:hypothetical protein